MEILTEGGACQLRPGDVRKNPKHGVFDPAWKKEHFAAEMQPVGFISWALFCIFFLQLQDSCFVFSV